MNETASGTDFNRREIKSSAIILNKTTTSCESNRIFSHGYRHVKVAENFLFARVSIHTIICELRENVHTCVTRKIMEKRSGASRKIGSILNVFQRQLIVISSEL